MKNELNNLEKSVMEMMLNNLDTMEGREGYVSDLAFELFEGENINGSITYSTYKAKEWITEHFHDLGDVVEEMVSEWDIMPNPFDNPEKFMVQVVLYVAEQLVAQSDYLTEWENEGETYELTYDTDTIEIIRREWQEALDC